MRRRPVKCPETGFPKFNTATEAWKAGNKLVRHPQDTAFFVDHCDFCNCYHYIVKNRKEK